MTFRFNRFAGIAALFLALTGLGGCAWLQELVLSGSGRDMTVVPEAEYVDPVPRVRPGVALTISVTASGITNREAKQYFVDAEGCITMELVGTIKCDKLSLLELQERITNAYKEYYVDPSVSATFFYTPGGNMVSPWGTVMVVGEVARPGPVDMPATQELSVMKAIMLAGGVNSVADKRDVQVTRCLEDGTKQKKRVDLIAIGEDGDPKKDIILKAGDVVYVPMAWY